MLNNSIIWASRWRSIDDFICGQLGACKHSHDLENKGMDCSKKLKVEFCFGLKESSGYWLLYEGEWWDIMNEMFCVLTIGLLMWNDQQISNLNFGTNTNTYQSQYKYYYVYYRNIHINWNEKDGSLLLLFFERLTAVLDPVHVQF